MRVLYTHASSSGGALPVIVAAVAITGVGILAAWWPAHHAASVDPLAALRRE
jgi:ABC-type lipoprotein release transport system permease subunit